MQPIETTTSSTSVDSHPEPTARDIAHPEDVLSLPGNNSRLAVLKDRHAGRRCFVMGNGPSLRMSDLDMLKNEITIASNKIYLAFGQTDWRPTYFTICDAVVARNHKEQIEALDLVKVCAASVKKSLADDPRAIFVNPQPHEDDNLPFVWDLLRGARAGHSVVNLGIKLAYWMGIREIYIIGVDFSFKLPSRKTGEIVYGNEVLISEGEVNHFHPDYRKPGEEWTVPQLDTQRAEFIAARKYIESHGGKIMNASRSTKLDAWDLVDFDSLFPANAVALSSEEFHQHNTAGSI